jgi:hypothetical protein
MPRRVLITAVLLLTFGASATARAATPLTVGIGYKPGVAVDAAGTAYVAWYGSENTASLQFCRLPRGAAACDLTVHNLAAPGTSLSRPAVVVSGTRVAVIEYRYPQTGSDPPPGVWEFLSTDGGASFDPGRRVGYPAFDEAVPGPGDTLSVATNASSEGMVFQNMPIDGTTSTDTTRAVLSLDHPYNGTIGLADAATPVVAFSNGSSLSQFRRYDGSGSVNDAANWTAPVDIGYADYPHLAGGPSGLFLLAGTETGGIAARKFDGTTFGQAVVISESADDAQAHLTQDAGGRVHAVFPRGSVDGLQLVHAVSDDGVNWRSGTLLTQPPGVGINGLRVAVAPDHIGVTAWESAVNATSEIRVAAIGPDAPAPAAATLPTKSPAKASRTGGGEVKVSIKGVLGLPPGVTQAAGCQGKLAATVKRGHKSIAKRALKLSTACKYRTELTLKRSKVKKAKHLALTLSFPGNNSVGPATARYLLKIKGK